MIWMQVISVPLDREKREKLDCNKNYYFGIKDFFKVLVHNPKEFIFIFVFSQFTLKPQTLTSHRIRCTKITLDHCHLFAHEFKKKTHTHRHMWKVCELRFWFQKSTSIIFLYTRDKFEDLCWGEILIEHGMEVMSRPLFLSTRKLLKGELSLKFTNSQLNLCICLVCFFYNNFFILSYLRTESISKFIWKWCMKLIDRQARALHVLLTW